MHSQDNEDHAFDMNAEHEPIPEADNDNDDMPDMVGDFPDNDYAGIIVFCTVFCYIDTSPRNEHWFSSTRPVKLCSDQSRSEILVEILKFSSEMKTLLHSVK